MKIDLTKITTNFCVECLKSVPVKASLDPQGNLELECLECNTEEFIPLGEFHE